MTEESKRLLALLQAKRDNPNRLDMIAKLNGNLADNKAYLDLTAPTADQRNKQVVLLTKQINRLIRLAVNQYDGNE